MLIGCILLLTAALVFGFSARQSAALASVVVQGRLYREVDLSVSGHEVFSFSSGGHHFTCEAEHGRIRVLSADCPDQVCVRTGWLDAPGKVIACVPGGVLITWRSSEIQPDTSSDIDVVLR